MIRVVLNEKYKSLLTAIDIQLPDFTIISGVNGAGKSHLLKAIDEKIAEVYDNELVLRPARYVNSNLLIPNDSYQIGRDHYANEINNIYNTIQTFINQKKSQQDLTFEKFIASYNSNYKDVINLILQNSHKIFEEIDHDTIKEYMPIYSNLVQDIFYQNFSAIFKRYSDQYDDNIFNEFLSREKGIQKKYLTEEQFIEKFGTPPWEFVNQIFEEANIGYTITNPVQYDRDLPYFFKLVNKSNGINVNFNDLSSGEKVLMSLALALYNATLDIAFPKLLMLDEPDAPLHPSMAKQLLRVVEEVFVRKKGVKVIMTTHSPSTVAIANEESLYVMQKNGDRLIKMSKEKVVKILTTDIPSLSINIYNTRQVFVESTTDVLLYSRLYLKLKQEHNSDISLNFLSSGVAKGNSGNCDQVKEIVKLLTDNGNRTTFGIIDWDRKNNRNERISVLGEGIRYSIENYILDPLLLASFILRERNIRPNSYFGLPDTDKYYELPIFPPDKLQRVVDAVLNDLEGITGNSSEKVEVKYMGKNGQRIVLYISRWFLEYQGHDLEDIIRGVYPELNRFRGNLKKEIIDKVFDDFQEFISVDFLDLFEGLHH